MQDPAENRHCPLSLAVHAITAGLLTTVCFLCRQSDFLEQKEPQKESGSPRRSAVKLWDELVPPVVMGKQRLLCPSRLPMPRAVTLLSTCCAGRVCALSPAPDPRDSGHQGSARAGSGPAGGTRRGGRRWAAPSAQDRTPEAREASADGTRDMPQTQILRINVVTFVRWGVASAGRYGSVGMAIRHSRWSSCLRLGRQWGLERGAGCSRFRTCS